ncbi:Ig-like domain-containing protein [Microbacterium sp. LWH10-1.2]|uniref:Ig-like domain-containing protein n=1 Tax=Microbacterium sp. LWH10-1.2 TaxID=3135255 RepID=UPI00313A3615
MPLGDRGDTAVRPRSRGRIIAAVAGVATLAAVVAFAVTAQGYQAQEVPRLESSVWVVRDSGQYARVNTDLAEIDTVRDVDSPEHVWQSGAEAVLFSQGSRQRWDLDPADPKDLLSDSGEEGAPLASQPTPTGTREIVSAGSYVAYLTDTGQVSVSTLGPKAATALVDPFSDVEVEKGEERPTYTADAIGLSPDGILVMYSSEESVVRRFDVSEHRFLGEGDRVASKPSGSAGLAMTVVGDTWALLQPDKGRLWLSGRGEPVSVDVGDDALLQSGASSGDRLFIADGEGLVSVSLPSGESTRVAEAKGAPAAPLVVGGKTLAAWIDTDSGTLWTDGETVPLAVPDAALESASIRPVLQTNGDRAVLVEAGTGLIWTAPEGRLIPLEQWAVDDETEQQEGTVVVEDVAEELPPVAVADSFGVRSGQQVILPVLFNDHDPNKKDVLTIDPASVGALADAGFGDLSLVGGGQSLVVDVRATSGQTTFTYTVTDGAAVSEPTTVTLTVVAADVNSAPVWCGVEACQQEWPAPQLLPGGSTIVDALAGWVDPEGDPFVLSDAYETDSAAPVMVVPMADGRVAIRHTDPNASDAVVSVTVVIQDSYGATAEKILEVHVTGSPTLTAAPIALTVRVEEPQSIRVADHISGGSGTYRLLDAVQTAAADEGLEVSPNAASGTVDFTVAVPGQYLVTYTAQDVVTQAEKSAVIRLTAVDGSSALAMAPLTAFVREGEDTTVDVLRAVQNTSGRVLIVSEASSSTPRLDVGIVGNESIRVSGTTETGESGVIGSAAVTVADGAGAAVKGTVTVFLAPPSTVTRPIVFPDAITVRAGALARIEVAANDVAPRGEALIVQPEVIGSGQPDELVFADGNSLRYLAPQNPGTYRLTYAVSLERNPSLSDTGTVTVTVVPPGTNRAPTPTALTGRVLTGQTVTLKVPTTGVDADGDRVVLADVTQPGKGQGTVTVTASGDAIVYRAPAAAGAGGQVGFSYTVRDPGGEEGTGQVRIGVLDGRVDDAAPVTYSDYVRVQAGSASPVILDPRANDLDPAQGDLELIELVPNAPQVKGNPYFERLDALIDESTSLDDGRVVLRAGETAGTNSYIYTVRSTRTQSTSQGLIVVTVTDDAVTDRPTVADTVLTARTRAELSDGGLDVVKDRVRWASGDTGALTLSLWGEQPGFTVAGNRIVGEAPAEGALVPFQLTGKAEGGREVVAYGFLHIPPFDDLRVQLKPGVTPVVVDEEKSKPFDVTDYVDLPSSDRIEVGTGEFSVQRAVASCTPKGKTSVSYTAGADAPWSDTCLVQVRVQGQQRWSYVEVPVAIRPAAPQVVLSSASRTVAPGGTETVDLYSTMTSWEGGREGDPKSLDFGIVYSGASFTVTRNGSSLSIEARADAKPGTREDVDVNVSAFGGAAASLRLVVGIAPPDAPRGATFTRQCTVTSGGCTIDAVGVSGEYDPFQGKQGAGLTLVSLGEGARCDVATFSASGERNIAVSWPGGGKAAGGQCIVPFVVADAQDRTGTGSLTLDLQGYPQAPASVTTVGYTRTTVVLEVPLGEAANAHPAVSGVTIMQDGAPANASCSPSGSVYQCTVSGLVTGAPHSFTALAVNAVGTSAPTSAHTSWAYAPPEVSNVTATPVYRPGVTDTTRGVAALSIDSSNDAASFRVQETGEVIQRQGPTTNADIVLSPGAQSVTVVPISQFQPPAGNIGNEGGAFGVQVQVTGSPYFDPRSPSATAVSNSSVNVSGIAAQSNGSTQPLTVKYVAWRSGTVSCSVDSSGGLVVSGGVASDSPSIGGLEQYKRYNVKACVSNGFGVGESNTTTVFTFVSVSGPGGDTTYSVATTPSQNGSTYTYGLASAPAPTVEPEFTPWYYLYGIWRTDFTLSSDSAPGQVSVKACNVAEPDKCSGTAPITAATAPTTVKVTFDPCLPLLNQQGAVNVSSAASGSYSFSATGVADQLGVYDVKIDFTGAYNTLSTITHRMPLC